ncbi:MAG: hypothetical protein IKT45_10500 [Lachnospiraceae bacterium]|nr:hypothetical protein [Lachnospiraceae bacterium]
MIFDGRWKWELKKLSVAITFWSKLSFCGDMVEHQLNRAVLYSATILRKIVEDEIEAECIAEKVKLPLPEQKTVHARLEAIKYPYTGEEGWAVRSKLCASVYGSGEAVRVKVKDVCNWLLHSYVWAVAHEENGKRFAGFLVASDYDKEKFVHYIPFDEWEKVLVSVIQNAAF